MKYMYFLFSVLVVLDFAPQLPQQEEPNNIELGPSFIIRDVKEFIEQKDWISLVDYYKSLIEDPNYVKLRNKLYFDPETTKSYLSLPEYIIRVFSSLPDNAINAYRNKFVGKITKNTLKKARHDLDQMEKIIEDYFFCTNADNLMDLLAGQYMEQGDFKKAIYHLRNMLRYPYSNERELKSRRTRAMAQLAFCYSAIERNDLIKDLYLNNPFLGEMVSLGNRTLTLKNYLDYLVATVRTRPLPERKIPSIEDPQDRYLYTNLSPRPDLYDYTVHFRHCAEITGSQTPEFPVIPVTAEIDGKQVIIVNDGQETRIYDCNSGKLKQVMGLPQELTRPGGSKYFSKHGPFITVQMLNGMILVNLHKKDLMQGTINFQEKLGILRRNPAPLNSLRVYNPLNSKLLFSTDDVIKNELAKGAGAAKFVNGDFSFSLPVVIKGNRIIAGLVQWDGSVCGQTSYVVCFEKVNNNLQLVWYTELSSRTVPNSINEVSLNPNFIVEHDGVIYACTNTGTVAALEPYTGRIIWLHVYGQSPSLFVKGMPVKIFSRSPNYPVINNDRLYFLPMDSEEIVIVDTSTGKKVVSFNIKSKGDDWSYISHLQGIVHGAFDDFILLSGARKTLVVKMDKVDPAASQVVAEPLIETATWANGSFTKFAGHGLIEKDIALIPSIDKERELVWVLKCGPWVKPDGTAFIGAWRQIKSYTLNPGVEVKNRAGNILVQNSDIVISCENGLEFYRTYEKFMKEVELELTREPYSISFLHKYANKLYNREKYEESAVLLNRLETIAADELRYETRIKLYNCYFKLGIKNESISKSKAIDYLKKAREYAATQEQISEVERKLSSLNGN